MAARLAFLLLAVALAAAPQSSTSGTTQASADQTTIQGCVADGSGAYTLSDRSGVMYFLTGNTSDLSSYVGREVRVTGKHTSIVVMSRNGFYASDANSSNLPTFDVSTSTKIADSCKSK